MAFKPSRRLFIQSVAALVGSAVVTPTLALGRKPFVIEGEMVDSLVWHMWDKPAAPLGSLSVAKILPWDGVGYPIILRKHGWRAEDAEDFTGWYDFEWSNLRRDVPPNFWHTHTTDQYPNVHAYVREQRFGESPEVMRRTMMINAASGGRINSNPPTVP